MVHADEQRVLALGQDDEPPADQRPALEVEARRRLLFDELLEARLTVRDTTQVVLDNRKFTSVEVHDLARLTVDDAKARAQRFMARDDSVQRAAQSGSVELPSQAQPARDVVGPSGALELRHEP